MPRATQKSQDAECLHSSMNPSPKAQKHTGDGELIKVVAMFSDRPIRRETVCDELDARPSSTSLSETHGQRYRCRMC